MFKRFLLRFISFVFVLSGVAITERAFAAPVPTSGCFEFADYLDIGMDGGKSCNPGVDLSFNVDFPYGMMYGTGICSSTSAKEQFVLDTPSANSGNFCWCSLTGYDNGKDISFVGSSEYAIFIDKMPDDCENYCGCLCADMLGGEKAVRGALYGDDNMPADNEFCIDSGNGCTTLKTLNPRFCSLKLRDSNANSDDMIWSSLFDSGDALRGESKCTDQRAANPGDIGTPGSTDGRYCWCRATGYYDGINTYTATSSDWFYAKDLTDYGNCTNDCSAYCGNDFIKKFLCDLGAGQFCIGDSSYHVTYSCNGAGGTAPTDSHDYNDGDQVITESNTCKTPTDQVFLGWMCDGALVPAGGTFTINDNTTCNAMYSNSTFSVGTTDMDSGSSIQFSLSAQGTFYVNCGTGGTLSGPSGSGVVGNTITKNDTTAYTYTCTYSSAGPKTIGFVGTATEYGSSEAISFYVGANVTAQNANAAKVTAINGGLSSIFPQLSSGTYRVPKFISTFARTSITSIPSGLFSGYTTSIDHMFDGVFRECTSLTSIPSDLFSGITDGSDSMFSNAFYGCTGLTSIPSGLFEDITSGAGYLFAATFRGCTGLTGANAIPYDLFSGISAGAANMFAFTFQDCTGLTTLPSGLFASITNISNSGAMFRSTFNGCYNISGYIPADFFAGITPKQASYPADMMISTFSGCTNLATSCTGGTAQYTTGYESDWDGHVSCSTAYTVSYACDAHGSGSPTDSNSPYLPNATVTTLASSACTAATGYNFNGWNCGNTVNSGNNITAGNTFSMPASNVTCTAQWTPKTTTITYSCGTGSVISGQSGNMSQTFTYGEQYSMTQASNLCQRPGYIVYPGSGNVGSHNAYGWICYNNTTPVNTFGEETGQAWNHTWANLTCTPQWLARNYTVTYNCNGGSAVSGVMMSDGFQYDSSYSLASVADKCSRLGYDPATSGSHNVGGWVCTVENQANTYLSAASGTWTSTNDYTCRAQWREHTTSVTFNCDNDVNNPTTSTTSYTYNSSYNIANNAPSCSRPGYRRVTSGNNIIANGWRCSLGSGYLNAVSGTWTSMENTMTCTATWEQDFVGYDCGAHGTAGISHTDLLTMGASYTFRTYANSGCTVENGYTFSNWSCSSLPGSTQTVNQTWNANYTVNSWNYDACLQCTAQYTGNTYTITYAPGAAGTGSKVIIPTGTTASTTATYGASATLATNGYTAPMGYVFSSWRCRDDGGNVDIQYGSGQTVDSWPHAYNLTCTAQWGQNFTNYTITYSCGDGTGTPPANGSARFNTSFTTAANTCSRTGYTFAGWLVSGSNDIKPAETTLTWTYTGNRTLTAQWTPKTYTVTYDCAGGSAVTVSVGGGLQTQVPLFEDMTYGDSYTLPLVADKCTRTGYNPSSSHTNGWVCGATSALVNSPSASGTWTYDSDYYCTAQWNAINYTVSFGGGSTVTGATPTGSTSSLTNKHYQDTVTLPSSTFNAPTGFTFDKWSCNNSIGNKNAGATFSMPAANVTCNAKWKYVDYTVYFDKGEGSGTMSSQTGKHYGDTITLPSNSFTAPTGKTFDKWNCDNSIGDKAATATFSMPAANVTCTAQYKYINYTIDFAPGNCTGTMSSQSNNHYGDTITLPANGFTVPTGRQFDGWNCDNSIGDKAVAATFSMPAANVTCTAQCPQTNYTVTFNKGEGAGTMSGQTGKHYGDTITLPSNSFTAPTGKEFYKWNCDNSIGEKAATATFSMPAANVTCTAQYKYINYTVSFAKGDGSGTMIGQAGKHYGDTITLPLSTFTAPTGKTFDKWNCDNSIGDKAAAATFSMPAANVTCTAQYKYINYTVSFNKGDGSGTMSSQTGKHYGDTITLPSNSFTAPTGKEFDKWSCNNSIGDKAPAATFSMPAANVTCTAQYKFIDYTVSFNKGDGSGTMSSQTGKHYGDTITLPSSTFTAPTGKTFDKWNCDNSIGDKAATATFSMPAANVTCTAQWTAINYSITYYDSDCTTVLSGLSPSSYIITDGSVTLPDSTAVEAANITKTGYHFIGWKDINNPSQVGYISAIFASTATDRAFCAAWGGNRYRVAYGHGTNGSGSGSFSNDATYGQNYLIRGLGTDTSANGARQSGVTANAGYAFASWSGSDGNTYAETATITPYQIDGQLTLTAQWTAIDYTVSFAAGSAGGSTPTGSTTSQTGKHIGNTITLPSSGFSAPTGWQFDGWNCGASINNGNNLAASATFTMPAANVTCTAQWTQTNYTVSFVAGSAGGSTPSGSVSSLTNKHYGDTITLPSSGFTAPSWYFFTGWSCNNSIGNKAVGATFSMPAANVTCTAQWVQNKFSITTTNMTASSTFQFTMTATGTFIVDCGAGGVLTGSGVTNGNTITRSGTTSTTYTCTYSSAGTKVIKFGGAATGYNTNETASPVGFNTSKTQIASVSGNFYLLFPDLGASSGQKPRFYQTFYQCTNLTSIPANLFDGYTTGPSKMFYSTFAGCTSLASIPAGLFSTVTTGSSHMFGHTFSGCTLLKSIPADLFENLTTAADSLFYYTFYNCTGLGTDSSIVNPVPAALFSSLTNNLSNATYLFDSTFEGCSGLTSVPAGLFSNINTSAEGMFRRTFKASGLTSIPTTLFSNVTTGATYLFGETFYNCTGLTALPQDLFANVATPASQLFSSTFQRCTNLTGYIPPTLFGGLIPRQSTYPSNMMSGVFQSDSQLLTTCPNGTIDFVTGYESNGWENKKSCQPGSNITYACGSGSGTRPANTSVVYNTSFTPAANTCTAPSGYSFSGWLVSDTSDIKQPGTAFAWTYTEHKTLTAQWTAINYTVSFAEGDGSGTMDSQTGKHYGDTITLPSSTFIAPTGYHFDKWSCNPSVGNKAAGATFSMPTADVTCTAQYVANTLDLTWYKEDGTTVVSNTPDCTYGQTFTGLPTPPEKTGYHFKKWNVVQ